MLSFSTPKLKHSILGLIHRIGLKLCLDKCNILIFLQYKQECRLTIELLDTEHEPSEDPVEVERWSEYVEKYVNNEDSVTEELKDMLARKPVFLQR